LQEKQTPRGPKQDLPGRLSRDFRIHKLEKIVAGEKGKEKYPARQWKVCAAYKKQSEFRYIVSSAFFNFSELLVLRNTSQELLNSCKTSRNWGYLIKGPSSWQCVNKVCCRLGSV
jgi:hypothetical protein